MRHEAGVAIGERNDVGHRVGVVAGQAVGDIHLVAQVGAVNIPHGHIAAAVQVAKDFFHPARQRKHIAGRHAVHVFGNAAAQGIVTIGDMLGSDACIPIDSDGAVVLIIFERPALSVATGVRHVAAGIVVVGNRGILIAHRRVVLRLAIDELASGSEPGVVIRERGQRPVERAALAAAGLIAIPVVGVGQGNLNKLIRRGWRIGRGVGKPIQPPG